MKTRSLFLLMIGFGLVPVLAFIYKTAPLQSQAKKVEISSIESHVSNKAENGHKPETQQQEAVASAKRDSKVSGINERMNQVRAHVEKIRGTREALQNLVRDIDAGQEKIFGINEQKMAVMAGLQKVNDWDQLPQESLDRINQINDVEFEESLAFKDRIEKIRRQLQ